MARHSANSKQRQQRKARAGSTRDSDKNGENMVRTIQKCTNFPETRSIWMQHKITQDGFRALQNKLD